MGRFSPNFWSSFLGSALVLSVFSCARVAPPTKEAPSGPPPKLAPLMERNPLFENVLPPRYSAPLASLVAKVPPGSLGPRLILSERGKLVVWLTGQGERTGLFSSYLSNSGELFDIKRISQAVPSQRALELGSLSDGSVVASTVRRSGDEDIIECVYLGTEGELRGGPHRVADVLGSVLWTKVISGAEGEGLLFWAQRTNGLASIHVSPLRAEGPGQAIRIVQGVSAWQLAQVGSAVTLATAEGAARKSIFVRRLGTLGQVVGAPLELARSVNGGLDLDMAMTKSRIFVAWSATRSFESRLFGVSLDRSGNILRPLSPLTKPSGTQALLRTIGSEDSDRLYVVWDEPVHHPQDERRLFIGQLNPGAEVLSHPAELRVRNGDSLLPDFAENSTGLAILTEAFGCKTIRHAGESCLEMRSNRVGVTWGESVLSTPLTLPGGGEPAMSWDLSCSPEGCFTLLADEEIPTNVYLAELQGGDLEAPALSLPSQFELPRVIEKDALFDVPELSDLDGVQGFAASHDLISMVSYFDPTLPYVTPKSLAPDGRRAPVRALLQNLKVGENSVQGEVEVSSEVISYRARSLGGVALVPPRDGRSLLVWAALDNKSPQLFATLLDKDGRRVRQKMLTRHAGEVSDVAAVRVKGGFFLAWVDGRGASPQIHTMLVDEQLRVRLPAQAVTRAAVAPTGVSIESVRDQVFLVWSDSRGDSQQSDIYSTRLDAQSMRIVQLPRRLKETPGHSHSPELKKMEDGEGGGSVMCAWVDAAPAGSKPEELESKLHFVELGPDGEAYSTPSTSLVDGSVTDFSLSCGAGMCRALLAVEALKEGPAKGGSLWGASYGGEGELHARKLLRLRAGLTTGVSPILVGSNAYFADLDADGERFLLHRAKIKWTK